jgi:phosphoketolase
MACAGDVPTLETLAVAPILLEHLPNLKIRIVNVIDVMKLYFPMWADHQACDALWGQRIGITPAWSGRAVLNRSGRPRR